MKRFIVCKLVVLAFLFFGTFTQVFSYQASKRTDTLILYEKLSGVGLEGYLNHWFFGRGEPYFFSNLMPGFSDFVHFYSHPIQEVTKQDSLIINNFSRRFYIKFYNLQNQLAVEGMVGYNGYMIGDIKFYEENKLIRIEHWDAINIIVDSSCYYIYDEVTSPIGTWSYFKKGRLSKTKLIEIKLKPNTDCKYEKVITTTKYSKKGKVLWVRKRHKKAQ